MNKTPLTDTDFPVYLAGWEDGYECGRRAMHAEFMGDAKPKGPRGSFGDRRDERQTTDKEETK